VNCRIHGGEGTWAPMAEAALGYSAVSSMLDCFLDPAAFAALPAVPNNFHVHVTVRIPYISRSRSTHILCSSI